jgi:hypothetical protein
MAVGVLEYTASGVRDYGVRFLRATLTWNSAIMIKIRCSAGKKHKTGSVKKTKACV